MGSSKTTAAGKGGKPTPKPAVVDPKEFKEVKDAVTGIAEFLSGGGLANMIKEATAPALPVGLTPAAAVRSEPAPEVKAPQSAVEKAIANAKANRATFNEEWDAVAREIIGSEYIDHTEQENTRSGAQLFTIVIKLEKSNMPKSYLDMVKTDRRSKDVRESGIEGVVEWCRLVKQNLDRGKSINLTGNI